MNPTLQAELEEKLSLNVQSVQRALDFKNRAAVYAAVPQLRAKGVRIQRLGRKLRFNREDIVKFANGELGGRKR